MTYSINVLVIAGTVDARNIISELIKTGVAVTATVTTSYGSELLEAYEGIDVHKGKLDSDGMLKLINERKICCTIDASHPFAREASVNAIEACTEAGIPYLRFEREGVTAETGRIIKVKSFEEAARAACTFDGNIFLTIGTNNLKIFVDTIPDYKNRLFARILPDSRMVSRCEEAGLSAGNIIAVKGPFATGMNIEMLKHCSASVLVTKESGEAGGMVEKLEAAASLDIPVIMVERPEVPYTAKVSTLEEVMEFIRQQVK